MNMACVGGLRTGGVDALLVRRKGEAGTFAALVDERLAPALVVLM